MLEPSKLLDHSKIIIRHMVQYSHTYRRLICQKCTGSRVYRYPPCERVSTSEDLQAFQTMSTTPSSRKRKRTLLDESESGSLSIELSSLSDTQVGPILGVYGYVQASAPVPA